MGFPDDNECGLATGLELVVPEATLSPFSVPGGRELGDACYASLVAQFELIDLSPLLETMEVITRTANSDDRCVDHGWVDTLELDTFEGDAFYCALHSDDNDLRNTVIVDEWTLLTAQASSADLQAQALSYINVYTVLQYLDVNIEYFFNCNVK